MDPINLNPRYTNKNIPGKCIKCLAEQELDSCLRDLLNDDKDNELLQKRFEMLETFLRSPESKNLRDESEKYLAEGKQVTLKIHFEDNKPTYELQID